MGFILDKIVRDTRLSLDQRGPPHTFTALSKDAVPWFRLEDPTPDPDMSGLWESHATFHWVDGNIHPFRERIFGVYAICLAVWRIRMATIFITAATAVYEKSYYAPTLGLSYTAAYHGVLAKLALMGRVVIDAPRFTFANRHPTQMSSPPARIVGKSLRDGGWKFEPMPRNHQSVWMRLSEFVASPRFEAPTGLISLLSSLAGYDARVSPTGQLVNSSRGKDWPKYEFRRHAHLLLPRIADERHIAFYQGFGEDPSYKEEKAEGTVGPMSGWSIHKRSERMLDLAFDFLSVSCSAALRCICDINLTDELRNQVRASVKASFCDDPQPHEIRAPFGHSRDWRGLERDLGALEGFVVEGWLPD